MRHYKTQNLWFDQYQKKVRTPRVHAFHLAFMRRMAKSYSAVSLLILIIQQRIVGFVYGLTFFAGVRTYIGMTSIPEKNEDAQEIYYRLQSIFAKNKYGYATRFMSDFDLLLEGVLNERWVDESTAYYKDPITSQEV